MNIINWIIHIYHIWLSLEYIRALKFPLITCDRSRMVSGQLAIETALRANHTYVTRHVKGDSNKDSSGLQSHN